ncbi:hypothetical protein AAA536_16120 [Pseudomonas aeruginosa]
MSEEKSFPPLSSAELESIIGMQIRRDIDAVRARQFWRRALASVPPEELVEGLVMALSTGRYQEVPRCRCGGGLCL